MFRLVNKPFTLSCVLIILSLLTLQIGTKPSTGFAGKYTQKNATINQTVEGASTTIIHPSTTTTPSPKPTITAAPTSSPVENNNSVPQSSVPTPAPQSPAPPPDSLLSQVNAFRASHGLSAVHNDSNTCDFAQVRANEISSGFNHDGFTNRLNSHSLPYPSYSEVTENIAMNSDSSQVVPGWINSPGHAENMLKDTPNVCIKSSGNYFAYEGWKP